MSQSTLITAYLAQLTPQEQRVLKIAREHLESSFTKQHIQAQQHIQVLSEKQHIQVLSEKQQPEPIGTIQMTPLIAKSPLTSKL